MPDFVCTLKIHQPRKAKKRDIKKRKKKRTDREQLCRTTCSRRTAAAKVCRPTAVDCPPACCLSIWFRLCVVNLQPGSKERSSASRVSGLFHTAASQPPSATSASTSLVPHSIYLWSFHGPNRMKEHGVPELHMLRRFGTHMCCSYSIVCLRRTTPLPPCLACSFSQSRLYISSAPLPTSLSWSGREQLICFSMPLTRATA